MSVHFRNCTLTHYYLPITTAQGYSKRIKTDILEFAGVQGSFLWAKQHPQPVDSSVFFHKHAVTKVCHLYSSTQIWHLNIWQEYFMEI